LTSEFDLLEDKLIEIGAETMENLEQKKRLHEVAVAGRVTPQIGQAWPSSSDAG